MANLLDLPSEVLYPMLDDLKTLNDDYRQQTRNYYSLSLVSKRLTDYAQRNLYAAFSSGEGDETWRISSFLCTIIKKPWLAESVTYLRFVNWRAWAVGEEYDGHVVECNKHQERMTMEQRVDHLETFETALQTLELQDADMWWNAVLEGLDEVFLALILLLTPNVRVLDIHSPHDACYISKVIDIATLPLQSQMEVVSLQKVEDVKFTFRGHPEHSLMSAVLPLFALPALQRLSLGDDLREPSTPWSWSLAYAANLRYLNLGRNCLSEDIFHDIFISAPQLESLATTFCECGTRSTQGGWGIGRDGLAAILPMAQSLVSLEVDVHDCEYSALNARMRPRDSPALHRVGSLPKLRRLSAAPDLLASHIFSQNVTELLPPSLEELKLILPSWHTEQAEFLARLFLEDLSDFIWNKAKLHPQLAKIGPLTFDPSRRSYYRTAFMRLVDACMRNGVMLEGSIAGEVPSALEDLRFAEFPESLLISSAF